MAFYDEMAVMALEMIAEFGQPLLLRNTNPAGAPLIFEIQGRR